jgi:protein TonB
MVASLRPPPVAPLPPPPPLTLPEQPKPAPPPIKPPPEKRKPPEKPVAATKTWTQAVKQHLKKLDDAGQFYPPEAIARGLEGEVLVLIVIDESGHVSGARVEQGSGHRILDDAALRAVRSLRSLPADAPREALLPVRFRLR